MEKWEKETIVENLLGLLENIDCSTRLLLYLQQVGVLSREDVNKLKALGRSDGQDEKTSHLLHILQTRVRGYEHLAKGLLIGSQSGAFDILLKGIQKQAIFKDVLFEGVQLSLKEVYNPIGTDGLKEIIPKFLNKSTYEDFLHSEPWLLTRETVPKQIPYYIHRTLTINTQLDPRIFVKNEDDIFCIEGIELYQLSNLPSRKRKHNSAESQNPPDWSRRQIYGVTTRFILLERHSHFQPIADKSDKTVHWIKQKDGNYFYVKSSPGSAIEEIREFLFLKNPYRLSEDDLMERCLDAPRNAPILIYDSPGMGKSVLLAELARKIKLRKPESNVIYFPISELIPKIQVPDNLKKCVLDTISPTNKLAQTIMQNLFDSENHQIELFLDAFDEVHEADLLAAHDILDCISTHFKNIRMFISTRPHRSDELEEKFGVLGYNILPFDESSKFSFFLKYWHSEHTIEITNEIKQFARHCLTTLSSELSTGAGDIAGVPLKCKMLAEIYAIEARLGGLIITESQIQLNSIFEVYQNYLGMKFDMVCVDDIERELYYEFHVRGALRTLFSVELTLLNDNHSKISFDKIFRIGIFEPCKSDSSRLTFTHLTLAEFLAAEFLSQSMTMQIPTNFTNQNSLINILFGKALICINKSDDKEVKYSEFEFPVVCRFLNFFLSILHSCRNNSKSFKNLIRASKFFNTRMFLDLLSAAIKLEAVYLFKYILDVYLDPKSWNGNSTTVVTLMECKPDRKEFPVKRHRKLRLLKNLRDKIYHLKELVSIAVERSSLDLVKLSVDLLEKVTGRRFHKFSFDDNWNPVHVSLTRGNYVIFYYLFNFDRERFYKYPLLHWCLEFTRWNPAPVISDRVQIVKTILHERPDLLNRTHETEGAPLVAYRPHFDLIKCLIEAGADLNVVRCKQNIAHLTAIYFSPEEYRQLVTMIIGRNADDIFKQRDSYGNTPVHEALRCIELKTETLELIANNCNIDFNNISPTVGSELAVAIKNGRSNRVISDIIRLGGDRETGNKMQK